MKKMTKNLPVFWADLAELTKPGICSLALIMATFGFFLGNRGPLPVGPFLGMLVGLAFCGAASGILNQYIERDIDAKMWRTLNRPLPSGRFSPRLALYLGIGATVVGLTVLYHWVNPLTAFLGALTVFSYLALYTPSKRMSSLSTLIGAIPGALPPLTGWTAARNAITAEGLVLFGILFVWQIPHFLAIAWMYREDYARASLPILSVVDQEGVVTSKHVLLYTLALVPITLIPFACGMTGALYLFGALVLGVSFLVYAVFLAKHRTVAHAKRLFLASILYLPALVFLMVLDRV